MDIVVRVAGLEPASPYGRKILSLVRLPISPHPHKSSAAWLLPLAKKDIAYNFK